jgi:Ca-activated chloride channel family protein
MNPNQIFPDDPRLTLYALGEMEPAEQAEFAKLLEQAAAARQAVAEIRAMAATVTAALEQEPAMDESEATNLQREAAIIPGGDLGKLDGGGMLMEKLKRQIRFPQMYFAISGLAAACFAVFFVLWQNKQPDWQTKHLIEVPLTAAKEATDDKSVTGALPVAPAPALTLSGVDALNLPVPEPAPMMPMDALSVGEVRTSGSVAAYPVAQMDLMARQSFGAMKMKAAPSPGMHFAGGGAAADRDFNTEAYGYRKDNAYLRVADQPLSTFSVDVDTASYANVRRFLTQKQRPPADAVRIEELVNYFPYAYRPPTGNVPFAASLEVAGAPWAPEHRLVRIGLKGREVSDAARPAANLVFLLDVSGSMDQPNKLPLVKQSLRLLVNKLRPDDRVAIAVYARASGLALPSTSAREQAKIFDAIEQVEAGGSTNGAMGIQLAYDIAKANFIPGGVNRVILATDGDFNVGTTSEGELVRLIEEKAKSGVFLSVLGFGMGNLKDSTLEQLADRGNGNYAYIDSLAEAKKTLVEQAGGTLVTIAKDVKIQVEFNPLEVSAYRLIGYENRLLAKEDFNNDQVDAGEIGAGHTVTALYEVVPVGVEPPESAGSVDALKYQRPAGHQESRSSLLAGRDLSGPTARQTELLTVKIRYKEPAGDVSSKLEFPLTDTGARFEEASEDFKFAAAVVGFGMALRDSPHKGMLTLAQVAEWGRAGIGTDAGGYRSEFLTLVGEAASLLSPANLQ